MNTLLFSQQLFSQFCIRQKGNLTKCIRNGREWTIFHVGLLATFQGNSLLSLYLCFWNGVSCQKTFTNHKCQLISFQQWWETTKTNNFYPINPISRKMEWWIRAMEMTFAYFENKHNLFSEPFIWRHFTTPRSSKLQVKEELKNALNICDEKSITIFPIQKKKRFKNHNFWSHIGLINP